MNLKIVGWESVARDQSWWMTFVKAVMNIQILLKASNFLTR
jgi:hypothetical protein